MSLKVKVTGDKGTPVAVYSEGYITTALHQHPPENETIIAFPFRQYFTDDGTSSGSNLMNVDGSTNYVDFYISAEDECDRYIKYITLEIGDGGSPNLNKFGNLSSLTNGVAFYWDTISNPLYVLHEGIKTNKEFVRIGSDTAAIGSGVDAYLADVSGGSAEKSYLPSIDFKEIYGLPWGLRLRKGSTDRIVFRVQDDLSALTTFNAIATGTRI
jgi:hypothetical protein